MAKRKFYVVWVGHNPGIYDSWEDCEDQVKGFPEAKYKSFDSQTAATLAFRGNPEEHIGIIKKIASHRAAAVNYADFPEIVADSFAVDAACSKNPGPVEYRGVDTMTGAEIFHVGPLAGGTNNIGEFLAIIHTLAYCKQRGLSTTIYSDSRTAIAWIRARHSRTTIQRTPLNAQLFDILERANRWLATNTFPNQILKWNTDDWGEIPADFGRK